MRRLALVTIALATTTAHAQVTLTRVEFGGLQNIRLNAESCDATARLLLEGQITQQVDLVWNEYPRNGPNAPCPLDQTDPELKLLIERQTLAPINSPIINNDAFATAQMMGDSCTTPRRAQIYVCPQFLEIGGNQQFALDTGGINLSIDIDTTIPPAATVKSLVGGDGVIAVSVDAINDGSPDAYRFVVEHRLCPNAEFPLADDAEVDPESTCGAAIETELTLGSAPSITVPVANGRIAELRVSVIDDFENEGEPGPWQQGRPVPDVSPLALYNGPENALSCDTSSCNDVAPASLVGALALLRLRRLRRLDRRRRATSSPRAAVVAAVLVAALSSTSALAQAYDNSAKKRRPWTGLGRTNLSLSLGSYAPNLDAGSTFPVYSCFFGNAVLPQISGGADLHIWDGFGSLQVSVGFDAAQASGFAQPLSSVDTGTCQTATTTPVQVTFATVRPGVTYRLDPLLDWWSIPLVPYGRVGLVGTGYLFSKDGEVTSDGVHKPIGVRFGAEAAAGLMLALDFLDGIDPFTPNATQRARAAGSFDHTFVFVEGALSDVTSFGQPGFDLSSKDLLFSSGLPATFRVGIAVELL